MKRRQFTSLPLPVLFLTLTSTVLASSTWYVDGVNGSDANDCQTALTACKTIGHAISLASPDDSVMIAPATYAENLTVNFSLNMVGASSNTTIIDGGGGGTVVAIPNTTSHVAISKLTIRNGRADRGGGIFNAGTLTIYGAIISGNSATFGFPLPHSGGGIFNSGMLTITYSTVSGNSAVDAQVGTGGGIDNNGVMMISNTSITGNAAWSGRTILNRFGQGVGGGIFNQGTLTISNSTLAGNGAGPSRSYGGAIANSGTATISNSTVVGNTADGTGGGISTYSNVTLQNTIVANNSGGNCNNGIIKSIGYNLSSDNTCNFNGPGDLNNTDPKLGSLGYNGGPTQTIPLLSGSPAIDAGNPSGCTDAAGNLLTTDQRGMPRPDQSDTGGCDMGAYESQTVLRYIPVAPCRVADTRNPTGPFGAPFIAGRTSRSFTIPNSACGIASTAQAYSLNVTVVPHGSLGYLTVWPAGQTQPLVSTLNSLDGRIKANAAIVPAGSGGAISVFATDDTDVILDIDGYFDPASNASALAFYPMAPCRLVDTRSNLLSSGALSAGSSRTLPVLSSSCNVAATAQAYSLNFTVVPQATLGYLSVWPTGQSQPLVSTLNDLTGTVVANAAIVPAGTAGSIDVYATDTTDLVVDINGYYAPAGAGGLSLYTLPPCRVLDTRNPPGSPPFTGSLDVNVIGSGCGGTAAAQAYVFNATVVPSGVLGYLTLWPQGAAQPTVSTLNALDGAITSNMAIVPTNNTEISGYASGPSATHLILDMSGYFAP